MKIIGVAHSPVNHIYHCQRIRNTDEVTAIVIWLMYSRTSILDIFRRSVSQRKMLATVVPTVFFRPPRSILQHWLMENVTLCNTLDRVTAIISASLVSGFDENAVITGLFLCVPFDSWSNRFRVAVREFVNCCAARRLQTLSANESMQLYTYMYLWAYHHLWSTSPPFSEDFSNIVKVGKTHICSNHSCIYYLGTNGSSHYDVSLLCTIAFYNVYCSCA